MHTVYFGWGKGWGYTGLKSMNNSLLFIHFFVEGGWRGVTF